MSVRLLPPCEPMPVSSPWGPSPTRAAHNGVDFGIAVGTPLRAMAPGRVRFAGRLASSPDSGIAVGIDSAMQGHRVFYSFSHMSEVHVSVGDELAAGDIVGLSGNTGRVIPQPTPSNPNAGAHVHVRVDIDGVNVDPMLYIRAATSLVPLAMGIIVPMLLGA